MRKGWIEKVSYKDVAIVVLILIAVVLAGLVFLNFDAVNQRTQTIQQNNLQQKSAHRISKLSNQKNNRKLCLLKKSRQPAKTGYHQSHQLQHRTHSTNNKNPDIYNQLRISTPNQLAKTIYSSSIFNIMGWLALIWRKKLNLR